MVYLYSKSVREVYVLCFIRYSSKFGFHLPDFVTLQNVYIMKSVNMSNVCIDFEIEYRIQD